MEDKVDILMTTYNTKIEYLKKQIDSILNQTYSNINLLISDDNSINKEVQDVVKQYEKKDNRVKIYIQKENLGYIKNFEFLLKQSEAEYIMFSDHDDIWYEDKVEESLKKLKKEDVDLVYCNSNQIDENGKIIEEDYFKYKNVPLVNGHSNIALSRYIGIGCSQMFTKSVKTKMLPFTNEVMAHDWLVSFIANENKGIACIEKTLFGYRLHNTNVFGGRDLSQNLQRWIKENGKSYNSYLKYRNEYVIDKAYLNGALMCLKYSENDKDKEYIEKLIRYYKGLKKSKIINLHIISFFKFLSGNNLLKKLVKEIIIFHFPIIGYIRFSI